MSRPWHWVSIRLAYGCRLVPASPPKRQVANARSAEVAAGDRLGGQAHRPGVPVVEVDGEEQVALRPPRRSACRPRPGRTTSGFSTSSGTPARMTRSVGPKCASLGRHTRHQVGALAVEHLLEVGVGRVRRSSAARAAVRPGSRPTTAHQVECRGRSAKTWRAGRPHQAPVPTTATRIGRIPAVGTVGRRHTGCEPRGGRHRSLRRARRDWTSTTTHQERAADHLLVVRGEGADLVDQVLDHLEQQHAGERAAERAGAAGEQRAADDDRGDRLELAALADGGQAGRRLCGDQDAGETGEQGAEHVDQHLDPGDRQAHQLGRLLAAADGEHRLPEPGAVEHHHRHDERDEGEPAPARRARATAPGRSGSAPGRPG